MQGAGFCGGGETEPVVAVVLPPVLDVVLPPVLCDVVDAEVVEAVVAVPVVPDVVAEEVAVVFPVLPAVVPEVLVAEEVVLLLTVWTVSSGGSFLTHEKTVREAKATPRPRIVEFLSIVLIF